MKKITLFIMMFFVSLNSQATLLSFDFNQNDYQIGDVLTASIIVSDIEDDNFGFQRLLAAFNFKMLWDDSIVDYSSTSFGDNLNVGLFPSEQNTFDLASDSLVLSEVSFGFWDDLLPVQSGLNEFILATVNFNVIGSGASSLNFSDITLGDDLGQAFSNVNSNTASFLVNDSTDVPEPMTAMLILIALVALVKQRKLY